MATHVGRPLREMPNTYARRATHAWEDQDFSGLLAGETAVATPLTLARVLQRLARSREDRFGSFATASTTLSQFAPEPLDASRFAAWRSERQDKIGARLETASAGERGRHRDPPLPPLLAAALAAESWMTAGIADIPTARQALLAATGLLVATGTVRAVIPAALVRLPRGRSPRARGRPTLRSEIAVRPAGTAGPPGWPIGFLRLLTEGARAALRELDRLLETAERGKGGSSPAATGARGCRRHSRRCCGRRCSPRKRSRRGSPSRRRPRGPSCANCAGRSW